MCAFRDTFVACLRSGCSSACTTKPCMAAGCSLAAVVCSLCPQTRPSLLIGRPPPLPALPFPAPSGTLARGAGARPQRHHAAGGAGEAGIGARAPGAAAAQGRSGAGAAGAGKEGGPGGAVTQGGEKGGNWGGCGRGVYGCVWAGGAAAGGAGSPHLSRLGGGLRWCGCGTGYLGEMLVSAPGKQGCTCGVFWQVHASEALLLFCIVVYLSSSRTDCHVFSGMVFAYIRNTYVHASSSSTYMLS